MLKKRPFALIFSLIIPFAAIQTPTSYQIKISATIGEPKLNLFGYAPANSEVKLTGIGVSDQTNADDSGYFVFSSVFLPRPRLALNSSEYVYPEICLLATDNEKRTTQPTCIPPLPAGIYTFEVGPVLLSPTINLDKGKFVKGEQVAASGKTTPETLVNVFLARKKSFSHSFNLVKDIYAYYIPTYQTTSDALGDFEFNLPSDSVDKWRIFVAADIKGTKSPKSNTLVFSVHSAFLTIIELLKALLIAIRPYSIFILVALEVFILSYLLFVWKHLSKTAKIPPKKVPKEYLEIQKRYIEYLKSKGLLKSEKK